VRPRLKRRWQLVREAVRSMLWVGYIMPASGMPGHISDWGLMNIAQGAVQDAMYALTNGWFK